MSHQASTSFPPQLTLINSTSLPTHQFSNSSSTSTPLELVSSLNDSTKLPPISSPTNNKLSSFTSPVSASASASASMQTPNPPPSLSPTLSTSQSQPASIQPRPSIIPRIKPQITIQNTLSGNLPLSLQHNITRITPTLYVSGHEVINNVELLSKLGVGRIVNCMHEGLVDVDKFHSNGSTSNGTDGTNGTNGKNKKTRFLHLNIKDVESQDVMGLFGMVVKFIESESDVNRNENKNDDGDGEEGVTEIDVNNSDNSQDSIKSNVTVTADGTCLNLQLPLLSDAVSDNTSKYSDQEEDTSLFKKVAHNDSDVVALTKSISTTYLAPIPASVPIPVSVGLVPLVIKTGVNYDDHFAVDDGKNREPVSSPPVLTTSPSKDKSKSTTSTSSTGSSGKTEKEKTITLISCHSGMSRSITLAIAYLMYSHSLTALDAFEFVKSKRPLASPNFGFMRQLVLFERALFGVRKGGMSCFVGNSNSTNNNKNGETNEDEKIYKITIQNQELVEYNDSIKWTPSLDLNLFRADRFGDVCNFKYRAGAGDGVDGGV